MVTLSTIGHSSRPLDEFLQLVAAHAVHDRVTFTVRGAIAPVTAK